MGTRCVFNILRELFKPVPVVPLDLCRLRYICIQKPSAGDSKSCLGKFISGIPPVTRRYGRKHLLEVPYPLLPAGRTIHISRTDTPGTAMIYSCSTYN